MTKIYLFLLTAYLAFFAHAAYATNGSGPLGDPVRLPVSAPVLELGFATTDAGQLLGLLTHLPASAWQDLLLTEPTPPPSPILPPAASGHLRCIADTVINCATRTVSISAFLETPGGSRTPVTAPWSNGVTAHTIIVGTPGIYSWSTAGFTCDHYLNTVEINEFFAGTITLTAPQALCPNKPDSIEVIINPDYQFPEYEWAPPNPSGQLTPYEINVPGTYTVTVIDEMGCPFRRTITVPPSPPVLPILSAPQIMCPEGDTALISVTPQFNAYQWEHGGTTNPIAVYEPGYYTVVVTNQYGCTGERSIAIQNGAASVPPILAFRPAICPGQLDTLLVNGAYSMYKWSNGVNIFRNVIDQPGTYTVTVTNINGCTATNEITIGALPTPNIGLNATPLCPGGTATLSVTGGSFPLYKWSSGQTTSSITITQPGTYTVTVSGGTICATSTSIVVTTAPPPLATIASPGTLTCVSTQLSLNANGSSSGTGFQIGWTTQGGHFVSGQTTLTPLIDSAGLYILTIVNTVNGCIGKDTVAVQRNVTPPGANAGVPGTLTCLITSLTIGPPAPLPGPTLLPNWTTTGGNFTSPPNQWNPTVNQPGVYTLTVQSNLNGCTSTASVTINKDTLAPAAIIAPHGIITCTQKTVTISSQGSSSGPNFGYTWTTTNGTIEGPANQPTVVASSVGTYTLLVTNSTTGCTATSTTTITSDANIPTVMAATPDTLTCTVKSVTLNASGSSTGPNFSYNWTTANGNIESGGNTLMPVVTLPGSYTLNVLNTTNNCVALITVPVVQDIVPPTADAGETDTLSCTSPSLSLDGSGSSSGVSYTYLWSTTTGNITAGNTTLNPTIDKAGTYTLVVTSQENGCTATSTVAVLNDAATPLAVIAPAATLTCAVTQVALDATASSQGNPYTYLWDGQNVGGQTGLQVNVTQPGTYTLTVTNTQNGCTDVETIQVPQDTLHPIALAGPDVLLNCFQPTGSVGSAANPSGGIFTLNWSTAGGNFTGPTNGPTANLNNEGTYTLLITNTQNGCTDTDEALVTEDFVPPAANAGPGTELNCILKTYTLQGTGSTGPNFTYAWTTQTGTIQSGVSTLTPVVTSAGVYDLLISNAQNGCTTTASVEITSNTTLPAAAIATPATLTCAVKQITLDGTGSSQNGSFLYAWAGAGIVAGQGTLTLSIDQPGQYVLTVTNTQNGCTDVETIQVPQDTLHPMALAGPDVLLNCLQPTGSVGSAANPSGGIFTLNWSTAGGNFTGPTNGPTANMNNEGTYTLLITNTQNGCTDTDEVLVTEDFVPPVVNAGPGTELNCVLTEYTLQGTGSTGSTFTHQWTTTGGNIKSGATTLTPVVNGAGVYTLLTTNTLNGCTATATVQVTQSADVPTAVAGLPQTLTCALKSTTLNGTGSTTGPTYVYTWTTLDGNIVSGDNTLMPTIDLPGTYAIQVLNTANNCKATSSVVIGQNLQAPTIDAGPQQTLTCTLLSLPLKATVTASASQNLSYAWSTTDGQIISGGNTPQPTIGLAGTYIVTVTDALNGCTGTAQAVVVNDVNKPNAVIAPAQTLTCVLKEISLNTASSSTGPDYKYDWTTQGGNFVSLQNLQQPVVNKPGVYALTITNTQNGCTTTATVSVSEDVQLPDAEAGPTARLDCDDLTLSLNGTGSSAGAIFTYSWATANGQILSGGTTLNPQIGQPGLYTLTVKNTDNGCTRTDNVTITQDVNKPLVSIATPQVLTCVLKTTALTGSGSGFGPAPGFQWVASNGGNLVGSSTALQATVNQPGLYTLTVVNTDNACSATASVSVAQDIAPPPVQIKPAPRLTCTVEEVVLEALVGAQTQLVWTTQNGNLVSGSTTAKPKVDAPGIYLLTVTATQNGCTSTQQVTVEEELNKPTGVDFKLQPPLCTGKLGILTVEQIQGGIGPFRYSIDGGQTFFSPQAFEKLPPGNFLLVIQDANGCEVEEPISVPAPPKPAITLPPGFTLELGEDQELVGLIPPGFPKALIDTVIWTPLTGLTFAGNTIDDLLQPTAAPFLNTEYKVTIVTPEGCQASARTIIRVERDPALYAPNVIRPGDPDGDNSTFLIFAKDESVRIIRSLQIYDRWGNQVFARQDILPNIPESGWRGDFNGSPVNPAVFAWWAEVELIDGRVVLLEGDVTVLR